MEAVAEIKYDHCGRLIYHPEFHPNHKQPYTTEELEYICKYFEIDGPKTMGMAVGRTETTVATKVNQLKRDGMYEYYKNLNMHW